jgi:hypothetical protein
VVAGDMTYRVTEELIWRMPAGVHHEEIVKAVAVMHQELHAHDCVSEVFVYSEDDHVVLVGKIAVTEHGQLPTLVPPERKAPPTASVTTDLRPQRDLVDEGDR